MSWLTHSFQEHTVAWLLISSLLGGVIGATVKFVFEDVLRPMLGWQRETKQVVRRYTPPLVRSADSLERRINNLVRNEAKKWMEVDQYYRLSTLYQFGELLGWIRILEREFGFLPFESARRGRQFDRRLKGIFRALSSYAYFRGSAFPDNDAVEASQVPRLMLSAVGEVMTTDGPRPTIIAFTQFARSYTDDAQFKLWFSDLERFLREAHPSDPLRWDRLVAAGANVRALATFLDPRGQMVQRRPIANLEMIRNAPVRAQLEREFGDLLQH